MNDDFQKAHRVKQQQIFIVKLCYWAIIALLAYGFIKYCFPVWFPFVIAGIFASILNRPICILTEKTKLARPYVCVAAVLLFFGVIALFFGLVGTQAVYAVKDLASVLPSLLTETVEPFFMQAASALEKLTANLPFLADDLSLGTQTLTKGVSAVSSSLLGVVTDTATAVPSLFLNTIITIIATVFIALDYEKIRAFLVRQIPESKLPLFREMRSFFGVTLPKCLITYIFIMSITFVELMVGFLIFRIPSAVLLALIIAVVDILPVLGTGTVLIPWAIVEFLIGDYTRGIELALLYLLITVIRNSIEPKLVGKQIGLHPVVTFAGMLLGLKYMGLLGMFGVPLATAFVLDLNRKGIISIFK